MASHTPGPWYTREYRHIPTHKHPGNSGIAIFSAETGIEVPVTDLFSPNRTADAALIAAAPELLAALESLVKHVGDHDCVVCDAARAAIRAARGI